MPLPFKSYAPSPMKSASPQVAEMTFTPITVTAAAKENMVLSPTSNRNLAAIVSRVAPLAEIVLPGGDDGTNLPAEMKPFLHPDSAICLKKGLVKIFSLTSPDGKLIVVE